MVVCARSPKEVRAEEEGDDDGGRGGQRQAGHATPPIAREEREPHDGDGHRHGQESPRRISVDGRTQRGSGEHVIARPARAAGDRQPEKRERPGDRGQDDVEADPAEQEVRKGQAEDERAEQRCLRGSVIARARSARRNLPASCLRLLRPSNDIRFRLPVEAEDGAQREERQGDVQHAQCGDGVTHGERIIARNHARQRREIDHRERHPAHAELIEVELETARGEHVPRLQRDPRFVEPQAGRERPDAVEAQRGGEEGDEAEPDEGATRLGHRSSYPHNFG